MMVLALMVGVMEVVVELTLEMLFLLFVVTVVMVSEAVGMGR